MYACYIEQNTNNCVELFSLVKGFQLVGHHGYNNLIIEGDSQIRIQDLSKLLNGSKLDKISKNWSLTAREEKIMEFSMAISSMTPSHVQRKENGLADRLANEGVTQTSQDLVVFWSSVVPKKLGGL
jgi:ribonuclease HI